MYYGKLRRWYNENRGKFWKIVLIVICIIFFIQVANRYYINKSTSPVNTITSNTSNTELGKINNNLTGQVTGTTSLVSGDSIGSRKIEEDSSIVDEFIKYCNEKNIEEAYRLLTDECKELLYPTLEDFERIYYKNIYSSPKTYKLQNWTGNTYRINLSDDALSTGKVSTATLQDYITVKDNKLNINSYIGRVNINKITTNEGIVFNVLYKDTFMDYEKYTIQVKNSSGKTILLDDEKNTESIFIQDENGIASYAFTGEIIYSNLKLSDGQSKTFTFKFTNSYSITRKMNDIVFSRVITDYDNYIENKKDYLNIEKMFIKI